MKKHLFLPFILLPVFGMLAMQQPQPDPAKALFDKHCKKCHGADGTKTALKAKKLTTSTLTDPEIRERIMLGKGNMTAFDSKLSGTEVDLLIAYVKKFRVN